MVFFKLSKKVTQTAFNIQWWHTEGTTLSPKYIIYFCCLIVFMWLDRPRYGRLTLIVMGTDCRKKQSKRASLTKVSASRKCLQAKKISATPFPIGGNWNWNVEQAGMSRGSPEPEALPAFKCKQLHICNFVNWTLYLTLKDHYPL